MIGNQRETTMKTLTTNPSVETLIERWKEAKHNAKAWNDIRLDIEDQIGQQYGDFEAILDDLDESASLTTSVQIGDMEVTVGYTMAVSQPSVTSFMGQYPEMAGVLYKQEYKPITKEILKMRGQETPMAHALEDTVSFKVKKAGFKVK